MTESQEDRAGDLFDEIRSACRRVAESASSVRIDEERLRNYADDLRLHPVPEPTLDRIHHYVGDERTTVAYFVTLDAVNFGSGYFPHLQKRPGMSGYFTIASSLADRFRREGPIDPPELALIGPAACASLFGQDATSEPVAELMELFARALNDLGEDVIERFDGQFCGLVDAAGGSAARMVALLSAQAFFRDVSTYRGQQVPFYKRAQILASDLALALHAFGLGRFDDLERLTLFADNLVPHVLRIDGVLAYEPSLLDRIERGEMIPAGSEEEVEIRACALHAVERLVDHLRSLGVDVAPRDLDNHLWVRGQDLKYKASPRHRTRTVCY